MRKLISLSICLMLAGCASGAPAVSTPSPTPEPAEPAVTAEAEPAAEAEEQIAGEVIEAVLEEELPMSLKVTLQDFVVTFAKDRGYSCPDELQTGDYILITYTGDIENSPVALSAEKVK